MIPIVTVREPNFGDAISIPIVRGLVGQGTNIEPYFSSSPELRRLSAVGSTSHLITGNCDIWGSGSLTGGDCDPKAKSIRVWIARGPLSREAFKKAGWEVNTDEVCDAGVLAPFLWRETLCMDNRLPVGVMPHFMDDASIPRALSYFMGNGLMYIHPIGHYPDTIARRISACSILVTSSLHGAVFAEAIGIPVVLFPGMKGTKFKYEDYLLGTGRTTEMLVSRERVKACKSIDELKALALPKASFDVKALLKNRPPILIAEHGDAERCDEIMKFYKQFGTLKEDK